MSSATPAPDTAASESSAPAHSHHRPTAKVKARDVNDTIRYTMWSVFAVTDRVEGDRDALAAEVEQVVAGLAGEDLVVRGFYDVSGLRADADLMVWWHAPTVETLQKAYQRMRRTELGRMLTPVWSVAAVHRPAEFNKSHIPAFMAQEDPGAYISVYPFVRSYEWYMLPDEERRDMLVGHGMLARSYPDVRANTVPAFALGDYEWILAFEANELHRIVDVMRDLRAAEARRHVRVEIPFYAGPRVALADLVHSLP